MNAEKINKHDVLKIALIHINDKPNIGVNTNYHIL